MAKLWILAVCFLLSACGSSSTTSSENGDTFDGKNKNGDTLKPEDSRLFPAEYICRRDSIGNYGLYRLNDEQYIDRSNGSLEWCTERLPSTHQRYFCKRDSIGNFVLSRLPGLEAMDRSSGSIDFCIERIPTNEQKYYCQRDSIGNFRVVRIADEKVLDSSSSAIESCLRRLPR